MRTVIYTTAPKSYDYGAAVQLSPFAGRADLKPVRLLSINDDVLSHQLGRYQSGMYVSWTEAGWRKVCEEIPATYAEFEPITEETDLLHGSVQYRIADVDNEDGTTVPVKDPMIDAILIALGIFRRKKGGVVMRIKIEDILQRSEDGQLWEILKSGDRR